MDFLYRVGHPFFILKYIFFMDVKAIYYIVHDSLKRSVHIDSVKKYHIKKIWQLIFIHGLGHSSSSEIIVLSHEIKIKSPYTLSFLYLYFMITNWQKQNKIKLCRHLITWSNSWMWLISLIYNANSTSKDKILINFEPSLLSTKASQQMEKT